MTVLQKRVKARPQRHLSPENDSQSPTIPFLDNFRIADHSGVIACWRGRRAETIRRWANRR